MSAATSTNDTLIASSVTSSEPLSRSREGARTPDRFAPRFFHPRDSQLVQKSLQSNRGVDYQNLTRPAGGLEDTYGPGFIDPRHTHKRAQLLIANTGILTVTTDAASFVVPPQRAAWIPAGVPHEVQCRSRVSVQAIYIDPAARLGLPKKCGVIEVSGLLRELAAEVIRLPIDADLKDRDQLVMDLILDEILAAPSIRLDVPMPQDPRLVRVCRSILGDPAHDDTLDDWAKTIGMGRRTFTRVFRKETHMSFADWRQHVRLMEAVSRLANGEPVLTVALDVGYNSPSAFTAMFRRVFGVAPRGYLKRGRREES